MGRHVRPREACDEAGCDADAARSGRRGDRITVFCTHTLLNLLTTACGTSEPVQAIHHSSVDVAPGHGRRVYDVGRLRATVPGTRDFVSRAIVAGPGKQGPGAGGPRSAMPVFATSGSVPPLLAASPRLPRKGSQRPGPFPAAPRNGFPPRKYCPSATYRRPSLIVSTPAKKKLSEV